MDGFDRSVMTHSLSPTRVSGCVAGNSERLPEEQRLAPQEFELSVGQIFDRLQTTPEEIADFCHKWQIAELALFGSILRDDFRAEGEDPSDIDVLYLFTAKANYGLEIFEIQEELETLFDRKVDFVSKKAILNSSNWLRRQNILNSHRIIYHAR
jgi:uncharacterized protein